MTNDEKKKGYQDGLVEATFLAREENVCFNNSRKKKKKKEDWTTSCKNKREILTVLNPHPIFRRELPFT